MAGPVNAPFNLGAHIEARAEHPELAGRPLVRKDERVWTYREYRDESVRLAHFLQRRLGAVDESRPGHVAIVLENQPELLFLFGACGYTGLSLFGVNTGLRGDTLAGVLNQSRARMLIVDQRFQDEVEKVRKQLKHVAPENVLYVRTQPDGALAGTDLSAALASEVGASGASLDRPSTEPTPNDPLMVIYTSGTKIGRAHV